MREPHAVYLSPTLTAADQLREWRRAMGDPTAEPTTVELELRAIVGNLTITVRNQDKLPAALTGTVKALAAGKRRKVKPKAPKPAARFMALPGGNQATAYERAIRTGEWAPVPAIHALLAAA